MEIGSPSIQMIGGKYYWIAGAEEVHLLHHNRTAESGYAQKLERKELDELPVEIVYVGPENQSFVNDEEKAFGNLVAIIAKMNHMQDKQFVSFPLGKSNLTLVMAY